MAATAHAARQPLQQVLEDLRQSLEARFRDYGLASNRPGGEAGQALRQVQLGIELTCQLEERMLHPALGGVPVLDHAMTDLATLRNLAALLGSAAEAQRPVVAAMLEGVARLHFAALEKLLVDSDVGAAA
jgi:hypothetical protein